MMEVEECDVELCDTTDGIVVDAEGYVKVRVKSSGETGRLLLEEAISLNLCTPSEAGEQHPGPLQDSTPDCVEATLSPNEGRVIQVWGELETKMLLSLYAENLAQIGPQKPFATKKALWKYVATQINKDFRTNYSAAQVEGRLKTVLKRTKKSLDSNKVSGATRMQTAYDREVERVIGIDDSILPEVTMGAGVTKRKAETSIRVAPLNRKVLRTVDASGPSCSSASATSVAASAVSNENDVSFASSTSDSTGRARRKFTIQEQFLLQKEKLSKEKEANKERRHKEKMEQIKELNQTLQTLFRKDNN